jgi:predicted CoA-binding protein
VSNLIESQEEIHAIARAAKRIAVLGIKTEEQRGEPAFYVAQYLVRAGIEVIPVPVYYPDVTEILDRPVVRRLESIEGHVDIVDVFRRPSDLEAHRDALIALKPSVVWLQLGIRHDAFARALADSGIRVVQDRCLMVEHRMAMARG